MRWWRSHGFSATRAVAGYTRCAQCLMLGRTLCSHLMPITLAPCARLRSTRLQRHFQRSVAGVAEAAAAGAVAVVAAAGGAGARAGAEAALPLFRPVFPLVVRRHRCTLLRPLRAAAGALVAAAGLAALCVVWAALARAPAHPRPPQRPSSSSPLPPTLPLPLISLHHLVLVLRCGRVVQVGRAGRMGGGRLLTPLLRLLGAPSPFWGCGLGAVRPPLMWLAPPQTSPLPLFVHLLTRARLQ